MGKAKEKREENKTKGEKLKILCQQCNNNTNHIVIQSTDIDGSEPVDDEYAISWARHFQIVECQGCDTITFRQIDWFSEWEEPPHDNGTRERLFPTRSAETREIKPFYEVPAAIRKIYIETLECFNMRFHILCAAGLRATVEGICSDQNVTDGPVEKTKKDGTKEIIRRRNLEGKIAGLHEKRILTPKNAELLHEHRYLGNEALHELGQPSKGELDLAINIIEKILETLYELPEFGEELKRVKKKRKK